MSLAEMRDWPQVELAVETNVLDTVGIWMLASMCESETVPKLAGYTGR